MLAPSSYPQGTGGPAGGGSASSDAGTRGTAGGGGKTSRLGPPPVGDVNINSTDSAPPPLAPRTRAGQQAGQVPGVEGPTSQRTLPPHEPWRTPEAAPTGPVPQNDGRFGSGLSPASR